MRKSGGLNRLRKYRIEKFPTPEGDKNHPWLKSGDMVLA